VRTGRFTYRVTARCARDDVVALLSTFTRHSALHPLIEAVEEVPPAADAIRAYRITDRLRWGPIGFRIRYRADVLEAGPDRIRTRAVQTPRTTLLNDTTLREADGVVTADVAIELTAPSPLFRYAYRQARDAHLALASRLVAALEADPAG
jgi:hypothetical protein